MILHKVRKPRKRGRLITDNIGSLRHPTGRHMAKKDKEGIRAASVLPRFERLLRKRPDGSREPITEFCDRCGLDPSAWSRWKQDGAMISAESIRKVYEANRRENPWLTLEWLFYERDPSSEPAYHLVERMAADVLDAVKRTLELVPDSGAGTIELVRQEVPNETTHRGNE